MKYILMVALLLPFSVQAEEATCEIRSFGNTFYLACLDNKSK